MKNIKEVSTSELLEMLDHKDTMILDIRSIDAYNGWKLNGEKRGGHIKGAKSMPMQWTLLENWEDILKAKSILPDQTLVLYGHSLSDIQMMGSLLVQSGYPKVLIYPRFCEEWTTNPDLPMEKLGRYQHLVPAEWVKNIVDGMTPEEFPGKNTVICHAHYRNREAYLTGHIPGAIDINTLSLESPETWNRRSSDELKKTLESHGITTDSTVVLYGKYLMPDNDDEFPGKAAGHIGAIRCAMIMMYAGVKDVRVLNGGFQSWEDAHYEVHTEDVSKTPVKDFGATIPARPELIVDLPKAKEMLKAKDAELVSVRSWPEFIGEVSGYNYIKKKGRIPGAIFGNCGTDAYHMENYRNHDHTTREYHEIAEQWQLVGITPDKYLAFYCGTGWRGSEAFLNAWLMGWPNVSVFDGGWFEWSNDPNNPYETGEPK